MNCQASSCTPFKHANLQLLKSGKFSDVVFLLDDGTTKERIQAHKFILVSRSSVFETMFERWEINENCEVEIPEVDGKSFKLFLTFLYSNQVSEIDIDTAANVVYLANKYDVKGLRSTCFDVIRKSIGVQNVIKFYQVASRMGEESLQMQTMEFILKNGKAVLEDGGFLEIEEAVLTNVLKSDNLLADEVSIFLGVIRWAEHKIKCQDFELTIERKQQKLQNLIKLIRFPVMKPPEFTDNVILGENKGILNDKEIIELFTYFNASDSTRANLPVLPYSTNERIPVSILTANFSEAALSARYQWSDCREIVQSTQTCATIYTFKVDRDIVLTDVVLFHTPRQVCLTNYYVLISIAEDEENSPIVGQRECENIILKPNIAYKLPFDYGVRISEGKSYKLKFLVTGRKAAEDQGSLSRYLPIPATKAEVASGGGAVTFDFGKEKSLCFVNHNPVIRDLDLKSSSRCCISTAQVKGIMFTI